MKVAPALVSLFGALASCGPPLVSSFDRTAPPPPNVDALWVEHAPLGRAGRPPYMELVAECGIAAKDAELVVTATPVVGAAELGRLSAGEAPCAERIALPLNTILPVFVVALDAAENRSSFVAVRSERLFMDLGQASPDGLLRAASASETLLARSPPERLSIVTAEQAAGPLAGVDGDTLRVVTPPRWQERGPRQRPSSRRNISWTADPVLGDVVLAGGEGEDGNSLGDIWRYRDGAWREMDAAGFPARARHAAAFAPRLGRVVIHGGESSPVEASLADTWVVTETGVELVLTARSLSRYAHAMAPEPMSGGVILFGGDSLDVFPDGRFQRQTMGDTWRFDGDDWHRVADDGPPPRRESALVVEPISGQLLLLGGQGRDGNRLDDMWRWNGATWTQLSARLPAPRREHSAVGDPSNGRVLMFGGNSDDAPNGRNRRGDTWSWDGGSWTCLEGDDSAPEDRNDARLAVDPGHQGRVLLYAGRSDARGRAFLFAWTPVGFLDVSESRTDWPPANAFHRFVRHEASGQVVLIGGRANDYAAASYGWDGGGWRHLSGQAPRGTDVGGAYDPNGERVVAFGGTRTEMGASGFSNATYVFDGSTWRELLPTVDGPPRQGGVAMAFDPTLGEVLMFGGRDAELGTWSLGRVDRWRLRAQGGPGRRSHHWMAFDPDRKCIHLSPGSPDAPPARSYQWCETGWREHTDVSRAADRLLSHPAAAWDPKAGVLVRYGGWGLLGGPSPVEDTVAVLGTTRWIDLPKAQVSPGRRAGAGMAWHAPSQTLLIYGGSPLNGATDDLWALDLRPGAAPALHLALDAALLRGSRVERVQVTVHADVARVDWAGDKRNDGELVAEVWAGLTWVELPQDPEVKFRFIGGGRSTWVSGTPPEMHLRVRATPSAKSPRNVLDVDAIELRIDLEQPD